jgi:hypothetical protein
MARDTDHLAGGLDTENTGGLLTGFLAEEEEEFDPRSLWRLGSWGAASLGAVIVALYASQSSIGLRREQLAAADLLRQSQQIQTATKESQNETRRLASAVETLNGDRDRLYSRVTFLEQGLGSVTGAIARQNSAMAPAQAPATSSITVEPQPTAQNAGSVPVVAMATTSAAAAAAAAIEKPRADAPAPAPEQAQPTLSVVGQGTPAAPATPLVASKSMMAPPDAGATRLIEPEKPANAVIAAPMPKVVASVTPDEDARADASEASVPRLAVQRTEFGVDVGGANSVNGLRALWRGLLKSRSNAPLTGLRPIIVVKETSTGLGMQLRLVAGPLHDAADAAKICAVMIENNRTCETTVFEGQRLAIKADDPTATAVPSAAKPVVRVRNAAKPVITTEEPLKKPEPSTTSSLFGRR